MLGADVLGFQVPDDVANFVAAAERLVEPRVRGRTVYDGFHAVDVDAFPISIDFAHWDCAGRARPRRRQHNTDETSVSTRSSSASIASTTPRASRSASGPSANCSTQASLDAETLRVRTGGGAEPIRRRRLRGRARRGRGADRPDQLQASRGPTDPARCIYIDSSLDEVEMAAWFRAADALVVTSLADGMNLVAKEFVAARGRSRRRADPQRVRRRRAGSRRCADRQPVRHRGHQAGARRRDRRCLPAERAARHEDHARGRRTQRRAPLGEELPRPTGVQRPARMPTTCRPTVAIDASTRRTVGPGAVMTRMDIAHHRPAVAARAGTRLRRNRGRDRPARPRSAGRRAPGVARRPSPIRSARWPRRR